MGAVKRSRTPTIVLTANGEVHTLEDAQVFVHDLNLFVTVQLLEETPAVPSIGKHCEHHGYSYEWVSEDWKTIICKTDNFALLVVPWLSTNPESSSSSTSLSQDSLRKEAERAGGNSMRLASSSSSSPVSERSYELATRRQERESLNMQNHNKKTDDRKNSDDLLADLPEWLEEFKETLVDTELHASAHSSQDSDPEHPTKAATKSRKHSIYTHFPKDWNCDVC